MSIFKRILPYLIIVIVVFSIRFFLVSPARVNGRSMYSTLDNKDLIVINIFNKNYKRGNIVVFDYGKEKLVKRIIGLPGEHIKYVGGKLYVNNKEVTDKFAKITEDFDLISNGYETIQENYYFVMGDNRNNSIDSRVIGLVHRDNIKGVSNFRYFPLNKIGKFN